VFGFALSCLLVSIGMKFACMMLKDLGVGQIFRSFFELILELVSLSFFLPSVLFMSSSSWSIKSLLKLFIFQIGDWLLV